MYWVVYTQICIRTSQKVALFADRDYGAMAVTCWGGGDTLSLTKEINFPVPWPSRKAALKREGDCSLHHFSLPDRLRHNRKSNYTICAFQLDCWAVYTRGGGLGAKMGSEWCFKVASAMKEMGTGCYVLDFLGLLPEVSPNYFQLCEFITPLHPGSIIWRCYQAQREGWRQRRVKESNDVSLP